MAMELNQSIEIDRTANGFFVHEKLDTADFGWVNRARVFENLENLCKWLKVHFPELADCTEKQFGLLGQDPLELEISTNPTPGAMFHKKKLEKINANTQPEPR
jgi:hypothetical protein